MRDRETETPEKWNQQVQASSSHDDKYRARGRLLMILPLTLDQIATLKAHLKPGKVLVAKITREAFVGRNVATSGTPFIEFAAMPAAVMPALRKAVEVALNPKPKRAKKPKSCQP